MKYLLLLLFLVGCGGIITSEDYVSLTKICESNGGVRYVYVSNEPITDTATCNNGVTITRKNLK